MAGAGARRYARAVFELARDEGAVDEWGSRLAAVRDLFATPGVSAVLANPSIAERRRREAAAGMLGERAGAEGANLAKLLVAANRIEDVDAILAEYRLLEDAAAGRVRATVTTAVELSPEDRDRLAADLSTRLGHEVRLTARVDPAILGGLVVQVGDRVNDASLAGRLQQLRRSLAGS